MNPKSHSPQIVEMQSLRRFPTKHSDVLREEILELRDTFEKGYLRLAELLSKVRHDESYFKWGFRTFADYCDRELGFRERKAEHLIRIWDRVKSFKLEEERIHKIGWTKMRQIIPLLTDKNSKDLIHKAEKLSVRDLDTNLKSLRSIAKTDSQFFLKLPLGGSEYRIIIETIEEAKKIVDQSTTQALEMICQDWMEYKGAKPELTFLEDHIGYLEKVYGVKLEYDPDRKDG